MMSFRAVIPPMLDALRQMMTGDDEDAVNSAFEVGEWGWRAIGDGGWDGALTQQIMSGWGWVVTSSENIVLSGRT
jgi:hypothetical protein